MVKVEEKEKKQPKTQIIFSTRTCRKQSLAFSMKQQCVFILEVWLLQLWMRENERKSDFRVSKRVVNTGSHSDINSRNTVLHNFDGKTMSSDQVTGFWSMFYVKHDLILRKSTFSRSRWLFVFFLNVREPKAWIHSKRTSSPGQPLVFAKNTLTSESQRPLQPVV